ncbi:MAG: ABC transporter ATP-binding protein [Clostridiaceae bacterium]|nr:ABC transporter ATP-binding protein [Clostridiaceae bacterium]
MIEVCEFNFRYQSSSKVILQDISFKLPKGKITALLGNNGAGKSTLIKCLNRINDFKYTSGKILLNNEPIETLGRQEISKLIAYVPQSNYVLAQSQQTSVFETVLIGRRPHIQWKARESDLVKVEETLSYFNLNSLSERSIAELSGGERQKVFLARALAQEPTYLLLDEPVNNLDLNSQHEFMYLLKKIVAQQEIGVLIILHDLNLALNYCDEFLVLKNNELIASGDSNILTRELIMDVFNLSVDFIDYQDQKVIIFNTKKKEALNELR